ncbi:aldo/keto reductase [Planoprotostelium fungivorum]|uniref:Aldo/keto reductase n=1 Tax=Planoprotostelium fungivorum TaxID=1890364 RepID=A0A2P6NU53_9EUKA|nr:aldo/keto reductase [Planoprotostelium fungivorum]
MSVPQVSLGPEGPMVSQFVYGTMRLGDGEGMKDPQSILQRIDACYTYEELLGSALKLRPGLREKIQIITKTNIVIPSSHWGYEVKVKHYNSSAEHIRSQVERSLRVLHTDFLDIVLLHRLDYLMDADEVAGVMTELKNEGKVRHWGVSNHTVHQVELLQSRLSFPLVTNQIELSVTHLQPLDDGTLDQCQKLRISPMLWSPLGGGKLFDRENTDQQIQRIQKAISDVSHELNDLPEDLVAYAWLLRHPSKPVILLGTNNRQRMQSVRDLYDRNIRLDLQQWYSIWEASKGHPVP